MKAPLAMAKVMMSSNELVLGLADSAETFLDSCIELEAVFSGEYDGGDFCSGLIFGRAGSKMLIEIANRFIEIPDDHNPALRD